MNKTKIEWTDYTWNPVVGCKHGCNYCYARKMNNRFNWIKKWDEPQIFWGRLREPHKLKKPSKIFVCSMADLFGAWVSNEWINAVINVIEDLSQHTFIFLTKNPRRYIEFEFPKNCQLGVTITGDKNKQQEEIWRLYRLNEPELKKYYRFLSIEPLLGEINFNQYVDIRHFNRVIVGAMTGPGAIKPKKEWIDSINHPNIFYKDNIKKYL